MFLQANTLSKKPRRLHAILDLRNPQSTRSSRSSRSWKRPLSIRSITTISLLSIKQPDSPLRDHVFTAMSEIDYPAKLIRSSLVYETNSFTTWMYFSVLIPSGCADLVMLFGLKEVFQRDEFLMRQLRDVGEENIHVYIGRTKWRKNYFIVRCFRPQKTCAE